MSSSTDHIAPAGPRIRQRYEQIADHLVDDVRAGRLAPGERLPGERELAQRLGVGRASVREALGHLQVRGIVETRHGAGSFVAAGAAAALSGDGAIPGVASPADASPSALLEARAVLEPETARLAALVVAGARASSSSAGRVVPAGGAAPGDTEPSAARAGAANDEPPAALDPLVAAAHVEIESLLERMADVIDVTDPEQRRAWSEADRAFHRAIAAATGNPVLAALGGHLASLMDEPLWHRLRDDSVAVAGRTTLQLAEHRLIAAAVLEGDPDAAAQHARGHVARVRRYMALD